MASTAVAAISGEASRPRRAAFDGWKVAQILYAGLFLAFLYAPIILLLVLSFNDSPSFGLPIRGWTLKWYELVLVDKGMLTALANSFAVGLLSSAIAVGLALGLALAFRSELAFKAIILQMILIPVIVPGIVGGVILLISFGYTEIPFGIYTTVLVAHATWSLPFAFLTLYPRIHGFDHSIEEAAADLGASPWVTFKRIVFPIIRPGIISTFLFSFTLSFDEFVRTMFVIGRSETMPIRLWAIVTDQAQPFLPALAVLMMSVTTIVALAGQSFALAEQGKR